MTTRAEACAPVCDRCGARDPQAETEVDEYPDRQTGYVGRRTLCSACLAERDHS